MFYRKAKVDIVSILNTTVLPVHHVLFSKLTVDSSDKLRTVVDAVYKDSGYNALVILLFLNHPQTFILTHEHGKFCFHLDPHLK